MLIHIHRELQMPPPSAQTPPKGFIVGGPSAGGNLSAAVGTLARDEKLPPSLTSLMLQIPSLAIFYNPHAKHAADFQSFKQNERAQLLDRAAIDLFFDAHNPDKDSRLFSLYSDKALVSRAGLPPIYFQVCGLGPLRDGALVFQREVRTKYETPTKLRIYPGLPHSFWSYLPQQEVAYGYRRRHEMAS